MAFSNSAGVLGKFTLLYSNVGTVDASAPNSALFFNVFENDSGGTFSLTLSDGTNTATDNYNLAGNTLGTVSFLINPVNFASVNRSALTSFTLMYTAATVGGDLGLSNGIRIQAVPEPSSLAIALTGLAMAGVYFRRRKNSTIA